MASREPVLIEPIPIDVPKPAASTVPPPEQRPTPARELEPYEIAVANALSSADPRFVAVEGHVRAKHWDEARDGLTFFGGSDLDRQRFDLHLGAASLAAVLASSSGAAGFAHELRRDILGQWRDPAAARERIVGEAMGSPHAELARRLALAVDAVSEAAFARAEEERGAVEALAAPSPHAPRTPDSARRYTRERLTPWFEKKRERLDAARLAYKRVAEIEPDPSPRWLVAASERAGVMLAACADELERSIAPLEGAAEDTAPFQELIRGTVQRLRFDARDAVRACVSYAEKYRIDSDDVRECRRRLKLDP